MHFIWLCRETKNLVDVTKNYISSFMFHSISSFNDFFYGWCIHLICYIFYSCNEVVELNLEHIRKVVNNCFVLHVFLGVELLVVLNILCLIGFPCILWSNPILISLLIILPKSRHYYWTLEHCSINFLPFGIYWHVSTYWRYGDLWYLL